MTPEKFTYHFEMAQKGGKGALKHLNIVVMQVDLLIKLIESKKQKKCYKTNQPTKYGSVLPERYISESTRSRQTRTTMRMR